MEGKLINKNDQKANYLNQIKAEAERKRKKLKSSGINQRKKYEGIHHDHSKDKKTFKHTELNSTIYSQTALTPSRKDIDKTNIAMDLEDMAQDEF